MIGTVKNCTGNREYTASLTTPDSKQLQALYREMVDNGCRYCIMEVSSQALEQGRVEGCHFDIALFTNLTQDHLDYHKTFENYANAKRRLFVNCELLTFAVNSEISDFSAKNVKYFADSVQYELLTPDNIGRINIKIPGHFTVYNSMGAAACAIKAGADFDKVLNAVSQSKGVPGRAEVVPIDKDFTLIIDYAHSPDGLKNIISSIRETTNGRIITVFGCGGDRDKTKRPIMGKTVGDLSDVAVVTSDNPRSEDPSLIIKDILEGMAECKAKTEVIESRTEAIKYALNLAKKGDVVLLAGKGHET